jgi:hypothetical protein
LWAKQGYPLDSMVAVMLNLITLDALILMIVWFLLLPSPAQAYFDLGTGTYLVQLILASLRKVFVKPKFPKISEASSVEKSAQADEAAPPS